MTIITKIRILMETRSNQNACIFNIFIFILTTTSIIPKSSSKPLHLHFHQITNGPDSNEVVVSNPNNTFASFGTMAVIDDPLHSGPELASNLIGRIQGLVTQASQQESPQFIILANLVFSDVKYNGSTLALFGRGTLKTFRDYSVVGGSGMFRLATGYVLGKVLDSSVQFDAYVECVKNVY